MGIDLSYDKKRCNFDCLYCELGGAQTTNSNDNPTKFSDIIFQVKEELKRYPHLDVITLTANGEPTLYTYLDELVDELNLIKEDKKLLILSNSSTINNPKIQKILSKIDIIKLSLDSVMQKSFKKIDRNHKEISLENIMSGLEEFSQKNSSKMVIEVLFVKSVNDSDEEILKLADFLKRLNPSRVDIGTIDRPPAYKVEPISNERLLDIAEMFKSLNVSIAYKKNENVYRCDYSKEQITALLRRRPLSQMDIEIQFSISSLSNLQSLIEEDKVKIKNQAGVNFYFS